ncbi:hypothetical protein [Acidocella sp. MX-AZ03]|uniref:hypothetical protein n=1 Tax=Acidocella sp. MX-AZ03 TaxID=2697363 RepID=UPI003FA496BE
MPGATVTVKDGDKVLGTATADAQGAFVLIPASPLPPVRMRSHCPRRCPAGRWCRASKAPRSICPAMASRRWPWSPGRMAARLSPARGRSPASSAWGRWITTRRAMPYSAAPLRPGRRSR